MYPPLSIQIVAWNSMHVLPDLLASLFSQNFQNFQILIIDNGSDDGLEPFLREQYPQITLIRNARNLGFTAAHNQGMRYVQNRWQDQDLHNKYILVLNPDVVMKDNCLDELLKASYENPKVGSFGPKLLRAFHQNFQENDFSETIHSDVIDSTGLRPHKNRTVTERGAGEIDKGQYDDQADVFGISGAFAMYRASALKDVSDDQEIFDNNFFAYKEDIDLSWRLQHSGWQARFVPNAIAYHYRGMYGPESTSLIERIKNRKKKSQIRNFYSNRNHWFVLLKNDRFIDAAVALPRIFIMESARVIYTLVFEPKNTMAFFQVIKKLPELLKKRKQIMKNRDRNTNLRHYFV